MIIHTEITRFYGDIIEGNEYSYLFRDLVVIDAGCNTGMFSLWLQDIARQIYAIDISQENIELLNKTIVDSKIHNIQTFCVGISNKTGNALIEQMGQASHGGWRLSENGDRKIDVYTLSDFMANNKIERADVLKLDVEGEEKKIINSPDFPRESVKTIIGEFHGDDKEPFTLALEGIGYNVLWHPNNHFIAR